MTNNLTQAQIGLFNAAFLPTSETASPVPTVPTYHTRPSRRRPSLTPARRTEIKMEWAFQSLQVEEAIALEMAADCLELRSITQPAPTSHQTIK